MFNKIYRITENALAMPQSNSFSLGINFSSHLCFIHYSLELFWFDVRPIWYVSCLYQVRLSYTFSFHLCTFVVSLL